MPNGNNNQYVGHEEANNMIIAEAMGPLADQIYRTRPGTPSFTQRYGQGSNVYTQDGSFAGAVSGGQSQQNMGMQTGYNQQSSGYSQQGYGQQNSQGFSGYGESNPQYGQSQMGAGSGQNFQQVQSLNQMRSMQEQQWKMAPSQTQGSDYYKRLPKVDGKAIVAVSKNGQGDIQAFRLEDGTILDYYQMLSGQHMLEGLRVQENREGELIIRSVPDGFTDNNLDNLPTFQ